MDLAQRRARLLLPLLLAALALAVGIDAAAKKKLPPFITKCPSAAQEQLNACALQRARDALPKLIQGVPEFGIPALDPFRMERIVLDHGRMKMEFNDIVIHDMGNTNIIKIEVDLKKRLIAAEYETKRIRSTADYKLTGTFLGLPLLGSGNSSFVYHDVRAKSWSKLGLKRNPKDGLDYATIEDSGLTFEPSKVDYWFDNIFGRDQTLSDSTNALLNENWKSVFAETKEGIFEAMNALMRTQLLRVLKDVPFDEIFPS